MSGTDVTIDLDGLERIGVALADAARRRLLVSLVHHGGAYPSDLADELGIGRTNVSNHLNCLRGCGLVAATPEGRRVRYSITDPRLAAALDTLSKLHLPVDAEHEHFS